MFDPTIYENLKVVTEGAVYDLDLRGLIQITGRSDVIELAEMSRSYAVVFQRVEEGVAEAEYRLRAGTGDLAAELMSLPNAVPGCRLELIFRLPLYEPETECRQVAEIIREIWEADVALRQTISYVIDEPESGYQAEVVLDFNRKFGEEVIVDLPRLLNHMVMTLERLDGAFSETD